MHATKFKNVLVVKTCGWTISWREAKWLYGFRDFCRDIKCLTISTRLVAFLETTNKVDVAVHVTNWMARSGNLQNCFVFQCMPFLIVPIDCSEFITFVWTTSQVNLALWSYYAFVKTWQFMFQIESYGLPIRIFLLGIVHCQNFQLIRKRNEEMHILTASVLEVIVCPDGQARWPIHNLLMVLSSRVLCFGLWVII